MEVLSAERVSYTHKDGKKALDGVSLTVAGGEGVSIVGANGSGKSTLLYILDGILTPQSGEIRAFGKPIGNGSPEFRRRVALLFQNPQVQLFSLSVWDELCFGPLQLGLGEDEIEERASDILKLLGIERLKDRSPWNLSGGEMKKVAIGTCLSINPDVLLLDEPTTGLDPRSQVELIELIIGLREAGKTVITATHDLGIIEDISDRTVILGEDHRVMLEERPWEVLRNTGALLDANLIHRHAHRHAWYVHEHSHSGIHEHEHIPELTPPRDDGEIAPVSGTPEAGGGMTDIDKLRTLLEHWAEHNHEHAHAYLQWAERASAAGNAALAGLLREIADETKKIDSHFEKAKKSVSRQ